MALTLDLDPPLEALILSQIESGRFADATGVVRAALSLLERQQFDERLLRSIAEADAGLLIDADEAFDELDRELDALRPF